MAPFRFVAPAGTPIGFADVVGTLRHAFSDAEVLRKFEHDVRLRFGLRHCSFVSTGRAALTVALLALRQLSHGDRDEVVIPSYTCFSVPSSIVKAGLKVRLADIDATTLDYAPGALDAIGSSRVLAVVATNLYGFPNDIPAITRWAHARGVYVVDDAAQCLGGSFGGRPAGTGGDIGLYSLDKGKNITSIDGGILVTNSDRISEILDEQVGALPRCPLSVSAIHLAKLIIYAAFLHPHGYWLPNSLPFLGLGTTAYRTDYPLAQYDVWMAPMGRRLFARLTSLNQNRMDKAHRLRQRLPWGERLQPIEFKPGAIPAYLRFPVLVDPRYRDALVEALRESGIGATGSYPTAICDVPDLKAALRNGDDDAVAGREVARRILTLPTHGYVATRDVERMDEVITRVLDSGTPRRTDRN